MQFDTNFPAKKRFNNYVYLLFSFIGLEGSKANV